jgi:D-3-phosphoglycerate dehydrogenase
MSLAERLGNFAAHVATGNPKAVRLVYLGRIAEKNTNLIRNAGVAGVLNRSLSRRANLVNALPLASDRGWTVEERHEKRAVHVDSIRLELETDTGCTSVEGALVLDRPRLVQVNGIAVEVSLDGSLTFFMNNDVPGVIGFIGTKLGENGVNIANFSLGRRDHALAPGQPLEAVAVVETDGRIPDNVLAQLLQNEAIKVARPIEFSVAS